MAGIAAKHRSVQARCSAKKSAVILETPAGAAGAAAAAGVPRNAGHFGGLMLDPDRVDPADPRFAGLGAAGTVTVVAQADVEQILPLGWPRWASRSVAASR